jgi:peptide deformylase
MNVIEKQRAQTFLLTYPDEQLVKPSAPVQQFNDATAKQALLLQQVLEKLKTSGLSAPQINIHKRMMVLRRCGKIYHLVNPVIAWSHGSKLFNETCLCFPGKLFTVERSVEVVVDALDLNGEETSFLFDGEIARLVQHHIEHLNGVLINTHRELVSHEAA